LVLVLIIGWIFSGWPQIWRNPTIPPGIKEVKAANFSMQTGYYIGTGASGLAISGLGFQPEFVIIKADTSATGGGVFKTSAMPSSNTAYFAATANDTASNITFTSDGFTLGTLAAVNSANVRYIWIAFAGSDCTSNGTFCVGTYTGDGTSPKTITTGFQPSFAMVKRSTAVAAHFHTASEPANETLYFVNTVRDTTGNYIQSFASNGFVVGATDNTSGGTYYYIAFKTTSGIMTEGTYSGDATDNRNITGVGLKPDFVFVKNATNTTAANTRATMNIPESYGDYSSYFTATANAANNIQALQSDGFQVGSAVYVNGSGDTYYYVAFTGATAPSASGTFTMANGSYTGTGASFSITGLGFAPDLVIIKDNAANYAVFRTRMMGGDSTAYFAYAAANFTGGITSLDSDGFTIGTSTVANTSGNTYWWTAYGNAWKPYTNSGAADFFIGAYTGNAIDDRDIIRLPFQPDLVTAKRSGATAGAFRTSAHSGDLSSYFIATTEAANIIQALNSGGFQIGTAANVNTAGNIYFYFGFKSGTNFTVNTYSGTGAAHDITTVGFRPDHLWVKATGATRGVLRTSFQSGDTALPFLNVATITNAITGLISNGFSVGTNAATNSSGTNNYRYVAWRNPATFEQSAYKFFNNLDSTDVGTQLAAQNTPATLGATGDAFRLRMLLHIGLSSLSKNNGNLKLQFVGKGTGTCASPSGGTPSTYTDITITTVIAYKDNATPADGAALTANTNDPTHSTDTIANQTYEELNNFINSVAAIPSGQDGKWDFALFDNSASPSTTYCLRAVKSDDTVLDTYTVFPEITTAATAAVVSVSVSDGVVTYGIIAAGASKTTIDLADTQTLTNDGNITETFNIKGQNTACPWTLAATAGTDQYVHQFCKATDVSCSSPPTNYTALTTVYQTFYTGVAAAGTRQLDLRVTTPATTSCFTSQSVDVTIQAVQE